MINLWRNKQPGFTYSPSGQFTKTKQRIQKFKETGDTNHVYKNELNKACLQYDVAYGDFKDLARRAASDKVLIDKAFNIAKNPKYDGYQRGNASMVYKFFDKNSKGSGVNTHANNKIKQNQRTLLLATHQLAEELHKPIIKKLKKEMFIEGSKTIFGSANLANMQ